MISSLHICCMKKQHFQKDLLKRGTVTVLLISLVVLCSTLFVMPRSLFYGSIAMIVLMFGDQLMLLVFFKIAKALYNLFTTNNATQKI